MRTIPALAVAAVLALLVPPASAQQSADPSVPKPKAKKVVATKSQATPGMKTCNYKFPDGERRVWTCRREEPCCAWDAIKYVKCGSTVTNCL